jgi:DNA-binding transcriptional MerR regulator
LTSTEETEDLYRIGTVTKLTGIAVERLRAWERRYGLTPVHRSGKTRFYSTEQVAQLQQLKRLVDAGHPISSLVDLSNEQLEQRLAQSRRSTTAAASVGLIGPNLLVLEQRQGTQTRLNISARWANLTAYQEDEEALHAPLDVLLVQLPVLKTQEILDLQATQPHIAIIALYQFATPKNLELAQENSIEAVAWPLTWPELERVVATTSGSPLRATRSAPRRYSDADLIAIAASDSDPAGCPAHLVSLITQLNAFADYAASLSPETAEGNATYARVHTDATQARAQLELALDQFAEQAETLVRAN